MDKAEEDQQHDHHCILSIGGGNYRIEAAVGKMLVLRHMTSGFIVVASWGDCTDAQLDRYAAQAIQQDYLSSAGWNGETLH